MDDGITFDQFHKWLERRLEGAPELSVEKKAATPSIAPAQRRASLPMKVF